MFSVDGELKKQLQTQEAQVHYWFDEEFTHLDSEEVLKKPEELRARIDEVTEMWRKGDLSGGNPESYCFVVSIPRSEFASLRRRILYCLL